MCVARAGQGSVCVARARQCVWLEQGKAVCVARARHGSVCG